MDDYRSLMPSGFSSNLDYLEHLRLRENFLLPDKSYRDGSTYRLEYLQGVDSTGYSYHHGNIRGGERDECSCRRACIKCSSLALSSEGCCY